MNEEYLTEHWLFTKSKDEFDLFIEECRKKLNENLNNRINQNINFCK